MKDRRGGREGRVGSMTQDASAHSQAGGASLVLNGEV